MLSDNMRQQDCRHCAIRSYDNCKQCPKVIDLKREDSEQLVFGYDDSMARELNVAIEDIEMYCEGGGDLLLV